VAGAAIPPAKNGSIDKANGTWLMSRCVIAQSDKEESAPELRAQCLCLPMRPQPQPPELALQEAGSGEAPPEDAKTESRFEILVEPQ